MYEVTFTEADHTVDVEDWDALVELLGEDDAQLGLAGNLSHVVVVDLDEEPEYDGQPDEAQEWYDFDPDC